jgi:hypothetical protein
MSKSESQEEIPQVTLLQNDIVNTCLDNLRMSKSESQEELPQVTLLQNDIVNTCLDNLRMSKSESQEDAATMRITVGVYSRVLSCFHPSTDVN